MPNAKGGKKFKRGKKNTSFEKKLIYKDPKEDQEYGKVVRAMGNGRFEIQCFDGKTRMGIVAGNMRKRVWVNKDDIILFSKWEFTTDDDKCSIVHKYDIDESIPAGKNIFLQSNHRICGDPVITICFSVLVLTWCNIVCGSIRIWLVPSCIR